MTETILGIPVKEAPQESARVLDTVTDLTAYGPARGRGAADEAHGVFLVRFPDGALSCRD